MQLTLVLILNTKQTGSSIPSVLFFVSVGIVNYFRYKQTICTDILSFLRYNYY